VTVVLALVLSINALNAVLPGATQRLAVAGGLEVVIYVAASAWLVRDAGRLRARLRELGVSSAPPALLGVALLLGIFLHAPAGLLEWLGRLVFPVSELELRERALRLVPATLSERVALTAMVAMLAPFVEELFFRGALHARLVRDWSMRMVTAVTTVCFTISHPEPRLWLALASVGYVLGVVRALDFGILPSFLLHASFNATTLVVAFHGLHDLDPVEVPNPLVVAGGTLVCALLLRLLGSFSRDVAPGAR